MTFFIFLYLINKLKEINKKLKKEIIEKDGKNHKLEDYINDFIEFSQKYNISNINELKTFIKDKSEFINDDIMYIDFDIFEYEINFELKEQIMYYENQLEIMDNFFKNNNISDLLELKNRLSNNFYNTNKYNEIFNICNKNKKAKILEFESYSDLGENFIKNNINSKKDLSKEDLIILKETIKSSDLKTGNKDEKVNRFINNCKRIYKLSQKIKIDIIIKSNIKTNIRDVTNNEFDILLILIDNKRNF